MANWTFCHNDIVAANIIGRDEPVFIDWEYARDNDPLFDLAVIISHHQLPSDAQERLIDAYFDGRVRTPLRRLRQQQRRYNALHWLWLVASRIRTNWPASETLSRVNWTNRFLVSPWIANRTPHRMAGGASSSQQAFWRV